MTKNKKKSCFVISPIGKKNSDIRKRADQLFKYIIKDVVEEYDFEPQRADLMAKPGLITSQVIQKVVESELVVADLTGHNPNVFYELAIRHAVRKPLIQFMENGETIPFDIADTRTIFYGLNDLDNVDNVKKELKMNIENILKGNCEIETPISVSLELKFLRESEKPVEKALADILQSLSLLNRKINDFEKNRLSDDLLKNEIISEWSPLLYDYKFKDDETMFKNQVFKEYLNNIVESYCLKSYKKDFTKNAWEKFLKNNYNKSKKSKSKTKKQANR